MKRALEGLYLVVTPTLPSAKLVEVVEKALRGGVDILQLIPPEDRDEALELAQHLVNLARHYGVPLLINSNIGLAKLIGADGMHFDAYEVSPCEAKHALGSEDSIVGYTLTNDLERVRWAEREGADYISFCSVFPTASASSCEIVQLETVKAAKAMTRLPVFASGGINLSNVHQVLETGVDGVAVISAILRADDPELAARSFKDIIRRYRGGGAFPRRPLVLKL